MDALTDELSSHPDPLFVSSILHDLRFGCSIGFKGNLLVSVVSNNLSSALDHPEIVDGNLASKCARGHTAGPFAAPPFPHFRSSGVVLTKSGRHRLIKHLSASEGNSADTFIDKEEFAFRLITVDTVANHVRRTGPGGLVCKVDLDHAFHLCPVHPDDWPWLCLSWRRQLTSRGQGRHVPYWRRGYCPSCSIPVGVCGSPDYQNLSCCCPIPATLKWKTGGSTVLTPAISTLEGCRAYA